MTMSIGVLEKNGATKVKENISYRLVKGVLPTKLGPRGKEDT